VLYIIPQDEHEWYKWYENNGFKFIYKYVGVFLEDLPQLDIAFLITEIDFSFPDVPRDLRHKIITITHWNFATMPFYKSIPIRPFKHDKFHVLPIYPYLLKLDSKLSEIDGNIHIGIIGGVKERYNVKIMNLISPHFQSGKTYHNIVYHIVSRKIDPKSYEGCERVVKTYENISTHYLMAVVLSMDYILIDAADEDINLGEKKQTTSSLITAWSLLVPVIISNKMNKYYKFKNCIVYRKYYNTSIILHKIDIEDLIQERATFPTIQSALKEKYPEMLLPPT
jgi:hypothetical protein